MTRVQPQEEEDGVPAAVVEDQLQTELSPQNCGGETAAKARWDKASRTMVRRKCSVSEAASRTAVVFREKSLSRAKSMARFDRSIAGTSFDRDTSYIPRTYRDTMKLADARDALLSDARRYSPISLVLNLCKLPQTVLARIIWFPIVWILLATYAIVATLTRLGHLTLGVAGEGANENVNAYDGASVLVTFMVVFYVGYCYSRHFQIYEASRAASSAVLSVCVSARASLPAEERRQLFVYLNLMQVSAYCALTPVYNRANFMDDFCREHVLELPTPAHEAAFAKLDAPPDACAPTEPGASAYQCAAVWAMTVLDKQLQSGTLHGEVCVRPTELVTDGACDRRSL